MSPQDQTIPGSIYGHKESQRNRPALDTLKAPIGARMMWSGGKNSFCDFSWPNRLGSARGTVILVALCFVAVMAIVLGSYIAVCSRAMQMSNRSFQAELSRQLAEAGIEEALRAFNKNDWTDWTSSGMTVDWDTTTYAADKRAVATITYPSGKFGQGATAEVKIRVDNYDAHVLGESWSSSKTYRINDLVGYNGIWYRSVRDNNTNQTPSTSDLTWWIQNPMPWKWRQSAPYSQYEVVNHEGIWYRCISAHTSDASAFTSDSSYWTAIPTMRTWSSGIDYEVHDVVAYTDSGTSGYTLYRCLTAHTSSSSFSSDASNWSSDVKTLSLPWSAGEVYTRGAIVSRSGTWYYCRQSGTSSLTPNLDTSMWARFWVDTSGASGTTNPPSDTVSGGTDYFTGDYIYYSGSWYRCTTSHRYNAWAAASGNWTSTNALPYLSLIYRGTPSNTSNNILFYAGSSWYRYMGGWSLALTGTMHTWSSGGIKYNRGDAVYYSSTARWYRCILAHTSSSSINPTNATYWATTPLLSSDWDSSKNYSQNDTARYKGVWYLSIQNLNLSQNPETSTSYWIGTDTTDVAYIWNATTANAAGVYRCYDGAWYKCLVTNTGESPNNTDYWTPTWEQSSDVFTGAPVVYAEATVTLDDKDTVTTEDDIFVRTQLRAPIAPAPLFPNAVAASGTISVTAGGTVDSYDSAAGTYASQIGTETNYSATLAAGTDSTTAITLSNTAVKGYLAAPSSSTTPFAPLFSSGGTLKGFTSSPSPNLDLSRVSRSPYIPKFDTLPSGGLSTNWSTTPKGTALSWSSGTTVNLGSPGDTTPSRYYYNGNLTVGTTSLNVLRINGPVILHINGNLLITASGSTGRIEVSSTGSAEIHVAGAFRATATGEGILSYNTNPRSLIIISDNTGANNHYYSEGVNPLYGVIYVPNSTSTTGFYNDNSSANIYGAVSANNVTYSGANMNLHYDTSLRYATFSGVDQPYTVTEWRELSTAEQATMP